MPPCRNDKVLVTYLMAEMVAHRQSSFLSGNTYTNSTSSENVLDGKIPQVPATGRLKIEQCKENSSLALQRCKNWELKP